MVTPQITLRVADSRLLKWQAACAGKGISLSEQIRVLMDEWTQVNPPPEGTEERLVAEKAAIKNGTANVFNHGVRFP